jgi:phage terminase large subunit
VPPAIPKREGAFYEAFANPKLGWKTFHVPAWITPNFPLGRKTPADHPITRPYLISPRWVADMREKWGEDSTLWRVFIEAEFPDEDTSLLFPPSLLQQAIDRPVLESANFSLGVDVARSGGNRTAYTIMRGGKIIDQYEVQGTRTTETAQRTIDVFNKYQARGLRIAVDDTGVGGGVVDQLIDDGYDVLPIVAGSSANDTKRFFNRGSELYWSLREAFVRGEICIPSNLETKDKLMGQLAKITFEQDDRRERIIVHKVPQTEKSKNIVKESPDLADSLNFAYAAQEEEGGADAFMM